MKTILLFLLLSSCVVPEIIQYEYVPAQVVSIEPYYRGSEYRGVWVTFRCVGHALVAIQMPETKMAVGTRTMLTLKR